MNAKGLLNGNIMQRLILVFSVLLITAVATSVAAQEKQQVNVAVKIVEFQTTTGVETGLSAYFKQRNTPRPYGRVSSGNGAITSADITFPNTTNAGLTVFLDNITTHYGDIEMVLQALVDQNRAYILSRPKVMVLVGSEVPTIIETVQEIPYESTVVVGATVAQVTEFRPTGVNLNVKANQVVDDDGNPNTTDDIYIKLTLSATVNEEGSRITIALDDLLASGGGASNAISVPEFISRSVSTTAWVRNGQVLILGGLYRNTKNKNLTTLPWLTQGEDFLNGVVQRVAPFSTPQVPLTAGIGNQAVEEGRRELVFLVKSELWRPAYTISDEFGFLEEDAEEEKEEKKTPSDVITGVLEGISDVPKGIAEGLSGTTSDDEVTSALGGDEK